jgi:hypothetical protein
MVSLQDTGFNVERRSILVDREKSLIFTDRVRSTGAVPVDQSDISQEIGVQGSNFFIIITRKEIGHSLFDLYVILCNIASAWGVRSVVRRRLSARQTDRSGLNGKTVPGDLE